MAKKQGVKRDKSKKSQKKNNGEQPVDSVPFESVELDLEGMIEFTLSDFPNKVEWDKITEIVGNVVAINYAKVTKGKDKDKEVRYLIIATPDGRYSIGESTNLKRLFDIANLIIGETIQVNFTGEVPMGKGKQPMKQFRVMMSSNAVKKIKKASGA